VLSSPAEPWVLTAPESYLLRHADRGADAVEAFGLALKELVAREALCLEMVAIVRRLGLGARRAWLLARGPELAAVTEPSLAAVLAVYERRARAAGVLLDDLRRVAGRESRRYLRRDVAGSLQRRGLLTGDGARTAAGRRANEQLDAWLELGLLRLPLWASDQLDPSRALAYVQGAGSAILLIQDGYPALDAAFAGGHADVVGDLTVA